MRSTWSRLVCACLLIVSTGAGDFRSAHGSKGSKSLSKSATAGAPISPSGPPRDDIPIDFETGEVIKTEEQSEEAYKPDVGPGPTGRLGVKSAKPQPFGLRGRLLRGKVARLSGAKLQATHCSEGGGRYEFSVELRHPEEPTLFVVSVPTSDPKVGVARSAWFNEATGESGEVPIAGSLWKGDDSSDNREAIAGWFRIVKLSAKSGAVVEFSLDFGEYGTVRGRLGDPKLEKLICRVG